MLAALGSENRFNGFCLRLVRIPDKPLKRFVLTVGADTRLKPGANENGVRQTNATSLLATSVTVVWLKLHSVITG